MSIDSVLSQMDRFFSPAATPASRAELRAEVEAERAQRHAQVRLANSVGYWNPPTDVALPSFDERMASGEYGRLD